MKYQISVKSDLKYVHIFTGWSLNALLHIYSHYYPSCRAQVNINSRYTSFTI